LCLVILTGNGIVESLLGKMASLVGRVEDLVVENGEVQGETKTDGVSGGKVGLSDLGGSLVGLEGLVGRVLAAVAHGELGEVAVIVTLPVVTIRLCDISLAVQARRRGLHLVVEDLGLARLGRGDQVLVKDVKNVLADLGKLILDLLAVLLDKGDLGRVALVLLLLLDGSDYSPGGTASTDNVLVGNGEKVTLFDAEVTVLGGDDLHVLNHL
jgi:hypothetical protein